MSSSPLHAAPSAAPKTHGRIWRDLHDALVGSHQDFTEGPISRAIFLLAVPMILEMAMESLFGIVDVFFVARLGTDSVATVALTEGMLTIIFGVAMGLSMATTAWSRAGRVKKIPAEPPARRCIPSLWAS